MNENGWFVSGIGVEPGDHTVGFLCAGHAARMLRAVFFTMMLWGGKKFQGKRKKINLTKKWCSDSVLGYYLNEVTQTSRPP